MGAEQSTGRQRKRAHDRAGTERALKESALRLLSRDGVLAGLNLREVADEAGINRGLVYQYFGTRRQLLRAALNQAAEGRFAEVESGNERWPLLSRASHYLRSAIRHPQPTHLMTLLALDGDPDLQMMPLRSSTHAALQRDHDDGRLAYDDLDAVHVAIVSFVLGYTVFRDNFAKVLHVSVTALDQRAEDIFVAMLAGLGADRSDDVHR